MSPHASQTAKEIAALLDKLDAETAQKLFRVLRKEGVFSGCFQQECKKQGGWHHVPSSGVRN
jgi:hypothetical protein